jgi:hypothetical protein
VSTNCVNVPLPPYQLDAFTLFAYNVGVNNFCQSHTVAEPLNKGDYKAACDGLLKWVYVNGKPIKGLQTRREYERKMCLGELQILLKICAFLAVLVFAFTCTYKTSTMPLRKPQNTLQAF